MVKFRHHNVILSIFLVLFPSTYGLTVIWMAPAVTPHTSLQVNASTSLGALALAIETIYNESILAPGILNVIWLDSACSSKQSIGVLTDFLFNAPSIDVIFGPPCTQAMIPIAQLASYRNIPVFEWLGNEESLDDKVELSTLVRSIPPLSALGGILTYFIYGFKWLRIVLISASDSISKAYADSIVITLQSTEYSFLGVYIAHHYSEVKINAPEADIDRMFKALRYESRIVVLIIPEAELRKYMIRAYALGMAGGDYQFLFLKTSLPSLSEIEYLKTDQIWKRGDSDDAAAWQGFRNVLYIIFGNSQENIGSWHTIAKEAAVRLYGSSSIMPELAEPDKYSIYLYDAILLYAKVLNTSGVAASALNGTTIAQRTSEITFEGLSGDVILSIDADRYPGVIIYDLIANGTFSGVAYLEYYVNGTAKERYNVGTIEWGDGRNSHEYVPPDVPDCGFHGENCTVHDESLLGLYIGLPTGMVGILFILFLLYRIWRREKELNSMAWKVPFQALDFDVGKKNRSFLMNLSNNITKSAKSMTTDKMTEYTYGQTTLTDSFNEAIQKQEHHSVAIAKFKRSVVAVRHIRKKKIAITDRKFLKEMKMLMDLKHNNLTTLRGVCADPGHICVLWEYCSKGSLKDILENDDIKLDTMFKLSLAVDICKGLEYLHRSELRFHGGLKSSACVVDSRWTCKLTDFGPRYIMNSMEPDPTESDDYYYRSLFWTAPEFLKKAIRNRNRVGSPAGDIYSFGMIALEIISREPPYASENITAEEIIRRVLIQKEEDVFRPKFTSIDVSLSKQPIGGIKRLVERCWQEDPQLRPSAKFVLKTLNKINPYQKSNVIENMITMMERYSDQLEDLVAERTAQLEEEKRKTESLLYRMLPKKIAEQLKIGKPVQAEAFETVTIYFSDIVGFTSIAAASTPLQIVDLLNSLYTVFDDTIKNFDVYKVETIGDAYMIVSGLPERNGNKHVTEMASVSIALLSEVRKFQIPHRQDKHLEIRIGLHSGPVVAGVVGLTMPRYCLFGDTVNTASRMESNGQALKIHMSDATYHLLEKTGQFKISSRGEVDIKGKGTMQTYWLDGFNSEVDFNILTRKATSIDLDLQSASTLELGQTHKSSDAEEEIERQKTPFQVARLPSALDIQKQHSGLSNMFDTDDDVEPGEC